MRRKKHMYPVDDENCWFEVFEVKSVEAGTHNYSGLDIVKLGDGFTKPGVTFPAERHSVLVGDKFMVTVQRVVEE
jgi:hypothetical protein